MVKLSEAERSQFYTEVAAATSPRTAEILVHEVLEVQWDDLVTKSDLRGDLADLRGEFTTLKGEFADLRGEFAELKGEFGDLRGEFAVLKGEVADLRTEMRTGFAEVHTRFAQVDAKMEQRFHRQLVWLISAIASVAAFQTTLVLALH